MKLLEIRPSSRAVSDIGGLDITNHNIRVSNHSLTSLAGSPKHVPGDFMCGDNYLTSLIGGPETVGEGFACGHNKLKSLEGGPTKVGDDYHCFQNELESLEHAPKIIPGVFSCSSNKIKTLEHAPNDIGGNFDCRDNKLTSLKDIHKHIKRIKGVAFFNGNPIKSHVLGLMKIKDLEQVTLVSGKTSQPLNAVEDIINKHLNGDRSLLACQEDLIDAGFEKFAQL